MRAAALRLESFRSGQAAAAAEAMATEDAYQRGHDQGLKDGRDQCLDALSQAMADLCHDLAALEDQRASQRQRVLAEVSPVLAMVIDLLSRRSEVERLRDALGQELTQILRHGPEQALVIRCPANLRPEIESCLALAGAPDVRLEEVSPDQAMVEVICDQGRTRFEPGRIADSLKAIIADIQAED